MVELSPTVSKAIEKLNKEFGAATIMKLGDTASLDVEAVSTGSIALDNALGVGGLPRGRIIEIYGPESSGKTTLAMHVVAEVQRQGGLAAFIDAEHAMDPIYAKAIGVDVDNLLISQPETAEQILEIVNQLTKTGEMGVIVVDSVAAMVPKAELEGEIGDAHVGKHARLMSQALRMISSQVHRSGAMVIFINQLREKIGVQFGSPETTTGGRALKFYASVRLDIRRIGQIKKGADDPTGNTTRVKVQKNKVAPPFRVAEFEITFGEGISRTGEVVDLGVDLGIIDKSGAWFTFSDNPSIQGRDAMKEWLADNPEAFELARQQVVAAYRGGELPL